MKLIQVIMNGRMWMCYVIPFTLFVALCILIEHRKVQELSYFEFGGVISAIMVGAIQSLRTKVAEYNVLSARNCALSKPAIEECLSCQERSSLQLTRLIILGLITTILMLVGVVVEKMYPSITWLIFNLSCSLSFSCIANYVYILFDYTKVERKNLEFIFEIRLEKRKIETRKDLIERIAENKDDNYPEQWKR